MSSPEMYPTGSVETVDRPPQPQSLNPDGQEPLDRLDTHISRSKTGDYWQDRADAMRTARGLIAQQQNRDLAEPMGWNKPDAPFDESAQTTETKYAGDVDAMDFADAPTTGTVESVLNAQIGDRKPVGDTADLDAEDEDLFPELSSKPLASVDTFDNEPDTAVEQIGIDDEPESVVTGEDEEVDPTEYHIPTGTPQLTDEVQFGGDVSFDSPMDAIVDPEVRRNLDELTAREQEVAAQIGRSAVEQSGILF